MFDRRAAIQVGAAGVLAFAAGRPAEAADAVTADALKLGPGQPFSFDLLKAEAARLAARPYRAPPEPAPGIIDQIDYERWGAIRFDTDHALFADGPGRFPVTFFHLGKFFRKAVAMHVVDGGTARPIVYDPSYFDMPPDSPARHLPEGAGFAGFRIQEARDGTLDWRHNDWVAFLGAAYFRAIGALHQYGLSARAVALDVAAPGAPEEFPDFTAVYIERAEAAAAVTVHALLEGPSIVGACRFVMQRDAGVTMDIAQSLHLRADVARFGLAPLTSMYWFSETKKPTAIDWRPEVHDSDGLALWTGGGERLWRPLNNPSRITASAFADDNPRGFGLLQRDRVFDHYGDGVMYDKRPSAWVEPQGGWGKGAVELVEIPTDDEIHDNIVAMWVPQTPARAGTQVDLAYKLFWQADEPYPTPLARCVATRLGNGGQPGQPRPSACASSWSSFSAHRLPTCPTARSPRPCSPPRAAPSPTCSPKPSPTTCPGTGAPSST